MIDISSKINSKNAQVSIYYAFMGLLTLALIYINIDTVNLPLYGDELYYAKTITSDLVEHFFLENFGHPPLWNLQINILYNIFSKSHLLVHIVSLIYAILLLISLGVITRKLLDENMAMISMAGLFLFSTFQREAVVYCSENVMLLLALWGAYYFSLKDNSKAIVLFTLSTLFRENGVAFPVAAFCISYYETRSFKQSIKFLYAIIPLTLFFIYSYYLFPQDTFNTTFTHRVRDGFSFFTLNFQKVDDIFHHIYKTIDFGLYTLTSLCIAGVYFIAKRRLPKEKLSFLMIWVLSSIFSLLFFMFYFDSTTKDFMNFAIGIIILGVFALSQFKNKKIAITLVALSLIIIDRPRVEKRMKNRTNVSLSSKYIELCKYIKGAEKETIYVSNSTKYLLGYKVNGYTKNTLAFTESFKDQDDIKYFIITQDDDANFRKKSKQLLNSGEFREVYSYSLEDKYMYLYAK
jgi:hypothetical protein